MDCTATFIPYCDTFLFSSLVLDYIDQKPELKSFYSNPPNLEGIRDTISQRQKFDTNRPMIAAVFNRQYEHANPSAAQEFNINSLTSERSFTICTAHQPNIFTGYLYFIYKTVHVIRIAEELKKSMPEFHFVPVFYIGSEDNDLDELSQFNLNGLKYKWNTPQTGAVGRMKVDKSLLDLIAEIEPQISVLPYGGELLGILKDAYRDGQTIADATFTLLNHLFAGYGLLVLQPDDAGLKKQMVSVFKTDIFDNLPHALVENNTSLLSAQYKVQVNPREINLFYLENNSRERITEKNGSFYTEGGKRFTSEEMMTELDNHPQKFSPNVVLRGLYQETILPNILFVGGGSEIAYWLELKSLFDHFKVPYPVLVLRNSFLLLTRAQQEKVNKMGWSVQDLFKPDFDLMNDYVKKHSSKKLLLEEEIVSIRDLYRKMREDAEEIDITLGQHVAALENKAVKQLKNLEKKLIRAEKRNFEVQQRQLQKLKQELFPNNNLQERVENFIPFFALYGKEIISCIHQHSPAFDQQFGIIDLG